MYTLVTHHTFVVTCHKCKSIIGMFLEVESLRYYTFGFFGSSEWEVIIKKVTQRVDDRCAN